jgi:hypothetical protein
MIGYDSNLIGIISDWNKPEKLIPRLEFMKHTSKYKRDNLQQARNHRGYSSKNDNFKNKSVIIFN